MLAHRVYSEVVTEALIELSERLQETAAAVARRRT